MYQLLSVFVLCCPSLVTSISLTVANPSAGAGGLFGVNTEQTFKYYHRETTESPHGTTRSMGLATEACQIFEGLTHRQRAVCAEAPVLIPIMIEGINGAIETCREAFGYRRWNCSSFDIGVVFGKKMKPQLPGTKERAVMHAMASAGVVIAVARACQNGEVDKCGDCESGNVSAGAAYQWGSCSNEIWNSAQFAKRMLDARENEYTSLSALNLHNNNVGRETIRESTAKNCRCHGPSSSCSIKTCWESLPSMSKIAKKLVTKYDIAMYAVSTRRRTGQVKLRAREAADPERGRRSAGDQITKLFYLKRSPSYCDADTSIGTPGTTGRNCRLIAKKDGWDSCEYLCCGRGYRTEVVEVVEECNCEFKFCCYVACQTCISYTYRYFCL